MGGRKRRGALPTYIEVGMPTYIEVGKRPYLVKSLN